ncbi:hypothetical protein NDU88_004142 [Pleurodeles waltl]|uniref:Uncharacterized protein n=1 Tax=Pleurodeles waltl TaxID=8319 RepID=A0AAV7SHX3_PLEWA|nr:hypothetical protein NDU88_004142 [Pleurodeles waltl]
MLRFPTRISSGRQPITDDFRVMASRKQPFAPSLGKQKRRRTWRHHRRRKQGQQRRRFLQWRTGKQSTAAKERRAWKTPAAPRPPPGAPHDAAEGQEAEHPHSCHALGRAWPQQGTDFMTKSKVLTRSTVLIYAQRSSLNSFPSIQFIGIKFDNSLGRAFLSEHWKLKTQTHLRNQLVKSDIC